MERKNRGESGVIVGAINGNSALVDTVMPLPYSIHLKVLAYTINGPLAYLMGLHNSYALIQLLHH